MKQEEAKLEREKKAKRKLVGPETEAWSQAESDLNLWSLSQPTTATTLEKERFPLFAW